MPAEVTSLAQVLRDRAQRDGERSAYTFLENGETETASVSFAELDRAASSVAAWLLRRLQRGDRALLLYPSGLEFLKAFFGCLYAGVIAVPVFPPRRNRIDRRITDIVSDAQASIALTTSQILDDITRRLENAKQLERVPWAATDTVDVMDTSGGNVSSIEPNDLAFLQYTSGSTSTPKGVMVSHANLLVNISDLDEKWPHAPDSVHVSWLPVFHDMGLIFGMLQPLCHGTRCYFMPPNVFFQRPLRWLTAISRYRATHSAAPNFAFDMCVESVTNEELDKLDLSSWQVALNGAEPVRETTLRRFCEMFECAGFRRNTLCPGYGLAESTLVVSGVPQGESPRSLEVNAELLSARQVVKALNGDSRRQTFVSCGPAAARTGIAIVDPDSLTRCPPNVVGEIWVSGPSVAQGYWQRSAATSETFGAHLRDTDEGPFLRTGDMGFLHEGDLVVTGRLKDMIIIRGQNIFPQDIELTVEQSHPALRANCGAAFGVEIVGEERLVVAQEVNRSSRQNLNLDEIVHAIREAVFQHHAVEVQAVTLLRTASIPKTSSGKIQRHACRQGFQNQTLNVIGQWSKPETLPALGAGDRSIEVMDHIDAAFFGVDSDATPQVIAVVCLLDRQPDIDAFTRTLAEAVSCFPRLMQKVVREPYLGWRDDPNFRLTDHIRCVQTPAIRNRDELFAEVSQLVRTLPSLDHPPWEFVFVSNGNDQACLVLRMHHAVADGMRILTLLESIFGNSRDGRRAGNVEPAVIVSPPQQGWLAKMRLASRSSRKLLAEGLLHSGQSAINGTISGERQLTALNLSRSDLVRIMRCFRGSVHDVVFAIVAGAIRRYNNEAGVANRDLRMIIPMAVPPTREKGGLGNHLVISSLALPVSEPDVNRRFRVAQELFDRMKSDGTIAAYEFMAALLYRLVPRRFQRVVWETSLRKTNLVCTTMLGPEEVRYVGDARIEAIYGVPAPVVNHGAGFAFVSYAGMMCASVVSDGNVVPDPKRLMFNLEESFRELLDMSTAQLGADGQATEMTGEGVLAGQASEVAAHFSQRWRAAPVDERRAMLTSHVQEQAARVLGRSDVREVPLRQKLTDLGLDSMLALEFQVRLESSSGLRLPESLVIDHPTVEAVVGYLWNRLNGAESPANNEERIPNSR